LGSGRLVQPATFTGEKVKVASERADFVGADRDGVALAGGQTGISLKCDFMG